MVCARRGDRQETPRLQGAKRYCITRHVCNTFTQSCSSATRASPLGEQTTAAQVAALKTSGCELIFRDNASGGRWDRPELHKLLSQLRKGDVLVVWTLDRLSRSLRDVLTIMERVQERHAGFRSLKEAVDTTTPAGRMMMQMVGAFAEFERAMLKERTKAGLDAARKEGRIGGRPPKLKPHQQQEIVTLVKQGKKTAADAARLFGVHPATVSRLLRRTWIESSTVLSVPLLPKPQPRGSSSSAAIWTPPRWQG